MSEREELRAVLVAARDQLEAWRREHEWKLVPCPQCKENGHMIAVCTTCGWPPAMNGRCLCDE